MLAAKFERYHRFFRTTISHQGRPTIGHQSPQTPIWRTLYPPTGREGHPPVAVVFNPGLRTGEQALKNRMNRVLDLTRPIWSGTWHRMGALSGEPDDGYRDYSDVIPLLFTTLPRLHAEGPLQAVWWRCGHRQWETLTTALANPDDIDAYHHRDEQRRRQREQERQQHQAERQQILQAAQIPSPAAPSEPPPAPCERCGRPITGEPGIRYENVPPEDGRHCPDCRDDLAHQPPGLFKALFSRRY